MDDVQAIRCKRCGAPSYADQAREGFFCPFCRDFLPWAITPAHFTPDIQFRHRSVPIIEGLLKLTHVGLPEVAPKDLQLASELAERTRNTAEKLSKLDSTAHKAWNARELLEVRCKYCGASMVGSSTQNVFECEHCKNRVMDAEAFASGVYRKEVFGYDNNMFNKAIPFAISKRQAKELILRLAARFPEDFRGQLLEDRIDADLQALYLPYRLEDVSLKATVETEKGKLTCYHERINWAIPRLALFDIHLMNALHPWDFAKTTKFAPAYLEGDVQVFSPTNNEDTSLAMQRMLFREVPPMIAGTFGPQNVSLLTWDYNFRRHKNAYLNLPIWFLDKRPTDGEMDLQMRVAVNGQTGKTAALFLQSGQKDIIRTCNEPSVIEMSEECTLFSPPVLIEYVRSPFLFRSLSLDEAVAH